nr:NADPH-dependent F420 reductase [Schleiferilactobacillus harbinensis]
MLVVEEKSKGESQMDIGFIGTGNVGKALAQLFVHAGHHVVMSHRHSVESLSPLIEKLGVNASAGTIAEATKQDLVVLAVPFFAVRELPAPFPNDPIILDVTNYFPNRDGNIMNLQKHEEATSEFVARQLQSKKVVKAFNTIAMARITAMPRPTGDPRRIAVPVASDNKHAKATVIDLIDQIGFDAYDLGDLKDSLPAQSDGPLFISVGTKKDIAQRL